MLLRRHLPPPARHASTIAMMNKAIGDRQLSKKEALMLRKLDAEETDVLFQNYEVEQHELSLL